MNVTIWPRGSKRVYESASSDANTHITDVGELLDVTYSTRMEGNGSFGGHDLASWTIDPFGGYVGGLFRPGDRVRIMLGGGTCWEGEYAEAEPNADGTVTMHARGHGYDLYDTDSLYQKQVSGYPNEGWPTNRLADSATLLPPPLDQSERYGLENAVWGNLIPLAQIVGTLPLDALGGEEQAEKPIKLGPVLTGLCNAAGKRWAIWGRTLVIDTAPSTPMWVYDAPESVIGVADSDYRTHVYVQYTYVGAGGDVDGVADAVDVPGLARFDESTETVDYRAVINPTTHPGVAGVQAAAAQAKAAELLDQVKGRFLYTGSLTIGPESGLATPTGGKPPIAFVQAGQMLRIPEMRTGQGNLMPGGRVDFVIGKAEYRWSLEGEESLTITPQGAVARDLASILAKPDADPAADVLQGQSPAAA